MVGSRVPALALVLLVFPLASALFARALGRRGLARQDAWAGGLLVALAAIVSSFHVAGAVGMAAGRRIPLTATALGLVLLVCAGTAVVEWRRGPVPRPARERLRPSWFVIGGAAIVAATYAATILRALEIPPYGWDNNFYHLTLALRWSQTGSLGDPYDLAPLIRRAPGFLTGASFYPGNGNLFHLLALEGFHSAGARFVQLPFAVLGAFFTHRIGRAVGLPARAAAMGGLLYLAAPIVVFQSSTSYVDVVTASLLLGGILMGALWWRHRGPALAFATGLAFGLAIGSKYVTLLTALPLGAVIAVVGMARSRGARPMLGLVLLGVGALVPSAFWFVRNEALLGCPVYPVKLAAGDIVVCRGVELEDYQQLRFIGGKEPEGPLWQAWVKAPFKEYFNEEFGAGAALLALGTTGGLLAVLTLAGRDRRPALVAGGATVLLAAWWGTNHEPRHAIAGLGLAGVCAGLTIHAWPRLVRPLLEAGVIVALAAGGLATWHAYGGQRPVTSEGSTPSCGTFTRAVRDGLARVPPEARILNDLTEPGNHTTCSYALTGSRYQHQVVWELVPGVMPQDPGGARRLLARLGIDYVFLRKRPVDPLPARYAGDRYRVVFNTRAGETEVLLLQALRDR